MTRDTNSGPQTTRPRFPKTFGVPRSLDGTLPWSWAEERLDRAKSYWIVTVRPDAKPHAVPVWGLWLEGELYFGGAGRKGRNLRANPNVVVHLESADEVVIIEGVAERITELPTDRALRLQDISVRKYGAWSEPSPDGEPTYLVRPHVAFGWSSLPRDATRWRF